ncbi:MAG: hypothetical protein JNK21_16625 [Rhodospirillaceae bacterium]|nr:hypothetical protein [Rhodospirillaceae bacterium]
MAHGFHASFSVLEFNPRTQSLEIIHRIFIQDLELALSEKSKTPVTLNEDAATERTVRDYLAQRFVIATGDGAKLSPEWVGMKMQVDTLFVYMELKDAGALNTLTVKDGILTESHPGQVNTVNVTLKGRTQTLIFSSTDDAQTVTF